MKTYKVHPVAMFFPRLTKTRFDELKADVQSHGIRVPLLVNKAGELMDGRNRLAAAFDLKFTDKQVPVETFKGKPEDETAEIMSRNFYRRDLTDDQRVAITVKIHGPALEKESASLKHKPGKGKGGTEMKIAKLAKVGGHKARRALKVAKVAPEELDDVIAGKQKLSAAAKKADAKKPKQVKAKVEKSLRELVEAKFIKLLESFDPPQFREVRAILRAILGTKD